MNIITPVLRRFLCQHINGSDFLTNPTTDFVTYFQGNMLEKFKVVLGYNVSTITSASTGVLFSATVSGSDVIITHPFNSWSNEGFVVGNAIRVEANGNSTTGTVTLINNMEMTFTDASFLANLGLSAGGALNRSDYVLKVTTIPTSLIFKFGIIPNDAPSPTYNSQLTGEVQAYAVNGITAALTTLNYLGSNQSNLGEVQAQYITSSGTGSYIHLFAIEHVFQSPFYKSEWKTNYINQTLPISFQGSSSYKYVLNCNFGVNINNPNDGKIFTDDFQLGSAGFIGQNFNSGVVNYTLDSFTYPNGETTIDATTDTDISIVIKNETGNWTAGVKAYAYHTKLPDQSLYQSDSGSLGTFDEIFIFKSAVSTDGAGASTQGLFVDYTVAIDGSDATLLNVTATIRYSAAQKLRINAGDSFLIGVAVADDALSATLSDRVIVWSEQNEWDKSTDVDELISDNQIDFYLPGQVIGAATPETGFYSWNNRITRMIGYFRLAKEANSINAQITAFKVQIVSRLGSTDTFFKLDEFIFPFGKGFGITVGGTFYQVININETNTIGVPSTSDLNEATLVSTLPGSYQNYQEFDWTLSMEIPWREWIENAEVLTVAPEFYSALPDEFDNFNERTSNYSNLNSYDIYVLATADVISDGVTTTYHMSSDLCKVVDFDVDALAAGWSAATVYYDEAGDEVDLFPTGQNIHVEITIQNPGAALIAANIGAEIVCEPNGSNGRDYRLHNTLDWSEPVNYLKPLTGETYVKVTQGTGPNTVILECLIKKEKIQAGDSAANYNTYGHLYLTK